MPLKGINMENNKMLSVRLIEKSEFLAKYRIAEGDFKNTGLKWEDLSKLYDNYVIKRISFAPSISYLASALGSAEKVHSIRTIIKEPEQLVEKIIRKKIADQSIDIDVSNYRDKVTDLIGVRALH